MKAWGLGGSLRGNAMLQVSPTRVMLGGELKIELTTRRHHAGRQGVSVQVNGREVAQGEFVLRLPKA